MSTTGAKKPTWDTTLGAVIKHTINTGDIPDIPLHKLTPKEVMDWTFMFPFRVVPCHLINGLAYFYGDGSVMVIEKDIDGKAFASGGRICEHKMVEEEDGAWHCELCAYATLPPTKRR